MIKETTEKLTKGEISARELVAKYQDAIKKKDGTLNAYREVFDDAMEAAFRAAIGAAIRKEQGLGLAQRSSPRKEVV